MRQGPLDYERYDSRREARPGMGCAVAMTVLGVVPLVLGSLWLRTFVFTDHRAHLRPVGIPLGAITTAVGLALVFGPWLWRFCRRRK